MYVLVWGSDCSLVSRFGHLPINLHGVTSLSNPNCKFMEISVGGLWANHLEHHTTAEFVSSLGLGKQSFGQAILSKATTEMVPGSVWTVVLRTFKASNKCAFLLASVCLKLSKIGASIQFLKTIQFWASLVAQWLRIHLPMQGTRVLALGQEDPTCRRATKPMRHNY